jgi:hypothetical protein
MYTALKNHPYKVDAADEIHHQATKGEGIENLI